jgi:hypothetical protein
VTFNWVDWREWPSAELRRTPVERLSGLAALYARRGAGPAPALFPVGITSAALEGNQFWIGVRGINLKVISAADWTVTFAPPSVEEYLLHAIVLATLEYRLNAAGSPITEHPADEFQRFYFDGVRDKMQMRELVCAGRFKPDDERIIRRALGQQAFDAYIEVLSLTWLAQPTCPQRRPP